MDWELDHLILIGFTKYQNRRLGAAVYSCCLTSQSLKEHYFKPFNTIFIDLQKVLHLHSCESTA